MAPSAPHTTLPPTEIDPAAPGTIIRVALIIEAVLNLIYAIPLLLDPITTFRQYYLDDAAQPPPAALSIAQAFAVLVLGITAGMLLSVPNAPGAVEWRRMFYANSFVTEAMYAPLTFWQAWGLGPEGSGLDPGKLVKFTGGPLAVLAVWRAWVFLVKPEWFGRYRAVRKGD